MSQLQDLWDSFSQLTPQQIGDYWSGSNAQFEAGKPNVGQRVLRAVNPVMSVGSAIGSMQDAASEGDKLAMALAAYQALPAFGALRAVAVPAAGAAKASARMVPSLIATLRNFGTNTASQVAIDEAQSPNPGAVR